MSNSPIPVPQSEPTEAQQFILNSVLDLVKAMPELLAEFQSFSVSWGFLYLILGLIVLNLLSSVWGVFRFLITAAAGALLLWFGWQTYNINYIKGADIMTIQTVDGKEYTGYVAMQPFRPTIKIHRTTFSNTERQACPNIGDVCDNEVVLIPKDALSAGTVLKFHVPSFEKLPGDVAKAEEKAKELQQKAKEKAQESGPTNPAEKLKNQPNPLQ